MVKIISGNFLRESLNPEPANGGIWQQITDIYAECSIDYDRLAPNNKKNFMQWYKIGFIMRLTGHTAAEIIHAGADHTKLSHGSDHLEICPDGRILKSDVSITKITSRKKDTIA